MKPLKDLTVLPSPDLAHHLIVVLFPSIKQQKKITSQKQQITKPIITEAASDQATLTQHNEQCTDSIQINELTE
jgi:hypothetical protein